MAKQKQTPKTVRVARDAVTNQLVSTDLTPVRLAFERLVAAIDAELLKLAGSGDRSRLAVMLAERCAEMVPHYGE